MPGPISPRLRFARELVGTIRGWVWAMTLLLFGGLAAIQQVRDELPPAAQDSLQVRSWIPELSWQAGIVAILLVLLVLVVEAAYRVVRKHAETRTAGWSDTLTPVVDKHFHNETMVIDRKAFFRCNFESVNFRCVGEGPTAFTDCTFRDIGLIAEHPIANSFAKLRAMFEKEPTVDMKTGVVDPQSGKVDWQYEFKKEKGKPGKAQLSSSITKNVRTEIKLRFAGDGSIPVREGIGSNIHRWFALKNQINVKHWLGFSVGHGIVWNVSLVFDKPIQHGAGQLITTFSGRGIGTIETKDFMDRSATIAIIGDVPAGVLSIEVRY